MSERKQEYGNEKDLKKSFIFNKSYLYLLPMCGGKVEDYQFLQGCFVGDINRPDIKDKILLLYNKNYSLYNYQDEQLQELFLFEDKYAVNDNYYMYIFNLPKDYENNYHLFLAGKYSRMDDEYKRYILNFHKRYEYIDRVKSVLHRSEKLYREWEDYLGVTIPRTQEIGSVPDMSIEVFDKSILKDRVNKNEWI